jgi:hypothetical protein
MLEEIFCTTRKCTEYGHIRHLRVVGWQLSECGDLSPAKNDAARVG